MGPGDDDNLPLEEVEEWVNETRLVPQEIWETEVVEKVEHKTIMEERKVPQVKSLYPFNGQGNWTCVLSSLDRYNVFQTVNKLVFRI